MSQTTKRALEASLKNMLMKKPLSKITINDIAEDCGVSRMTVYYHFKDIYDLPDAFMSFDHLVPYTIPNSSMEPGSGV